MVSEDTESVKFCMSGEKGIVKMANTVPHDLGDPGMAKVVVQYTVLLPINTGTTLG